MSFCPNCGEKVDSNAKFCRSCGSSISANISAKESENVSSSKVVSQYTCPQCGAPVNSFVASCPFCKCEINLGTHSTACKELCDKLDQIEANRPKKGLFSMVNGLVNKALDKGETLDDVDRRKIDLISSFIIVSNKIEILDFIMLANSQINTCERILKNCSSDDEYTKLAQRQIEEAWSIKLEEALNRAEISLRDDSEYIDVKKTIIKEKAIRYKNRGLCSYCGGTFKGMFNKVCSSCKQPKNY